MTEQPIALDGYFLPEGFRAPWALEFAETRLSDDVALRQVRPTPQLIDALADHLKRSGREVLSRLPLGDIIDILDAAAAEWLDKKAEDYTAVMDAMAAATGFSEQMVRESLRIEQESSRADDMRAALTNEFGDPGVLDRFTQRPGARARVRALGPELTFCFLPGNIPALGHLPFMRALLVKSPVFCKTSSSEPVYAAAYARTLARLSPELARSLAVLYWPGGDEALEEVVFMRAGAIIAFGSAETCADIARRARPDTRLVLHGHKLGFCFVGREMTAAKPLEDLAQLLAYDIAMFDQQACLSPHWIFVEEGAEDLAKTLVAALHSIEENLPKGEATTEESVSFARAWDDAELASMMGDPVEVFSKRGQDRFLVCVDKRRPVRPSPLGRTISIVPVASLDELEEALAPYRGYFQNAAVAVREERKADVAERLARLGVTRICRPGRMPTPTMMWHHDGLPCLEALVRYCDLETDEATA